jgi:hypothetical protein
MSFARFVSAALLILLGASPALAWTDATRRRMLDDALKLTPPALASLLGRYHSDLNRGMIDPSREESKEDHRQRTSGEYGLAARMIASRGNQAVTLIGQPGRLSLAVYAMGDVAHYVADVNFPLNDGDGPPGDPIFYASYQSYVERALGRFPVVLERKPSEELRENRLEDFGRAAALRASAYIAPIREAYTPEGRPRSASAFDERSLPFGVASLSYSHAVNDIARVWTHVWKEAGGDMTGLPFAGAVPQTARKPGKAKKDAKPKPPAGAPQRPR